MSNTIALPLARRTSDNALRVAPDMDTGVVLKKRPTEYLRDLYFDTLVFTSEALRHLAAECGVSQLVVGTTQRREVLQPWPPRAGHKILM